MPLDRQAKAYLDRLAALGLRAPNELPPVEARRQAEANASAMFGPVEDVAAVDDGVVAGVRVRRYRPAAAAKLPMVVYFHGGGWVIGSVDTHDGACRALANRSGCEVVSVDYRLAPEHPFPAAVDDCWAVTRWAVGEAPRVAVAGDSAGGNLAAVMAIRGCEEGLSLALQLAIYPVTDHDFTPASYRDNAEGYGLTADAMRWYWAHYLGGADGSHPDASPLRAPALAGVAPAHVVVCEFDPLRDEGVAYSERLRREGVPVRLSEYDGMIHGFLRMAAFIDRTQALLDETSTSLREALAPEGAATPASGEG